MSRQYSSSNYDQDNRRGDYRDDMGETRHHGKWTASSETRDLNVGGYENTRRTGSQSTFGPRNRDYDNRDRDYDRDYSRDNRGGDYERERDAELTRAFDNRQRGSGYGGQSGSGNGGYGSRGSNSNYGSSGSLGGFGSGGVGSGYGYDSGFGGGLGSGYGQHYGGYGDVSGFGAYHPYGWWNQGVTGYPAHHGYGYAHPSWNWFSSGMGGGYGDMGGYGSGMGGYHSGQFGGSQGSQGSQFGGSSSRGLGGLGSSSGRSQGRSVGVANQPNADVYDLGTEYIIELDLPGYSREHVETKLYGRELLINIKAHRRDHNFLVNERQRTEMSRRLYLAPDADASRINASLTNGVLLITIPKTTGTNTTGTTGTTGTGLTGSSSSSSLNAAQVRQETTVTETTTNTTAPAATTTGNRA